MIFEASQIESEDTAKLRVLYNKATNIFRSEVKKINDKYKLKSGAIVYRSDSETKNDFLNGIEDENGDLSVELGTWDVWKYNPKARTEQDANDKFYKICEELVKNTNSQLDGGTIKDEGDWDGGGFYLYPNKPKAEKKKSYLSKYLDKIKFK